MDYKTLPIGGYDFPVITSRHLTETVQRTVRRTWKERLLTLPWRPWQAVKVVVETVPSEEIYLVQWSNCVSSGDSTSLVGCGRQEVGRDG